MPISIKEFKQFIIEENVPDTAKIYVQADHGQHIEGSCIAVVTREKFDGAYDAEDLVWEYDEWETEYDEDVVADYPKTNKIQAVLLSSI